MPNNQPLWSIDIEIRKNDRCIYKNVHYSTLVFGIWISNLHKSCHILPYKRLKYEKPPINLNHFLFFRWSAWKFAKKVHENGLKNSRRFHPICEHKCASLWKLQTIWEQKSPLKIFLWPPSFRHTVALLYSQIHLQLPTKGLFHKSLSTFETIVNFTFQWKIYNQNIWA